ncbi:MAG: hypothetical protein JO269_07275 [Burkholderiaceae bacterium]|nr:hypothetical protein [Burkholderiaceae bacterium]
MKDMKGIMSVMAGLFVAIWLCGCSTEREVHTADGSMVYAIDCYAQGVQACTEKAGEICGALGYHFVKPDGTRVSAESVLKPPPAPETKSKPAPPSDPKSASVTRSSGDTGKPAAASDANSDSPFAGFKLDRKLYIVCRA